MTYQYTIFTMHIYIYKPDFNFRGTEAYQPFNNYILPIAYVQVCTDNFALGVKIHLNRSTETPCVCAVEDIQ